MLGIYDFTWSLETSHTSIGFHLSNEGIANSDNFRCQTENVNLGFRTVDTFRNRIGHDLWKSIKI